MFPDANIINGTDSCLLDGAKYSNFVSNVQNMRHSVGETPPARVEFEVITDRKKFLYDNSLHGGFCMYLTVVPVNTSTCQFSWR